MSNHLLSFIITDAYAGGRLDNALQELFPNLSLRARKALWNEYNIYIQGQKAKPGQAVMLDDEIRLVPKVVAQTPLHIQTQADEPCLINTHEDWFFFSKPRGLHSQKIQGGNYSLEQWLAQQEKCYGKLFLCNRLDAQTSGIVVTARTHEAVKKWQALENKGLCQKRYVALVQNQLTQGKLAQMSVRCELDTHKRKITKVLDNEATTLRHSHFFPLHTINTAEYTRICQYFPDFPAQQTLDRQDAERIHLFGCIIYKGARHQIRAHAAKAGFALFNDVRYQEQCVPEHESFLLHHGSLYVGGVQVHCPLPFMEALDNAAPIHEFFSKF